MPDQISVSQAISESKLTDTSKNSRIQLKLWLDDYDTSSGLAIPIANIIDFRLRESVFLKLPYGQFQYVDDGSAADESVFNPGRIIYIGFEYATLSQSSKSKKSISKGRYVINGVKVRKDNSQTVTYTVTFIYDAVKLLNSIIRYPRALTPRKCSVDVIREVGTEIGLSVSTNCETKDWMNWINPNMKTYDFIQYVLKHSYVSDSDFLIFWVSKNGDAKANSVREMFTNGLSHFFDNNDNKTLQDRSKHLIFSDVYMEDLQNLTQQEAEHKYRSSCYILMNSAQKNNDSWITDERGNTVEVTFYDPSLLTVVDRLGDDMTLDGFKVTQKVTYSQINRGTPAVDNSSLETVRESKFNGFISLDTHANWETAPTRNEIMMSEFFANRQTITINTGKQLATFQEQELRIGDILDIDFSRPGPDGFSTADNGKYLLHTIDWIFKNGSDLFVQLRVAADATHA